MAFLIRRRKVLATPSYRIRKDKNTGLLVSPKEISIFSPVDNEPTFQSPSGPSAQASVSSVSSQSTSFVTSEQFMAIHFFQEATYFLHQFLPFNR